MEKHNVRSSILLFTTAFIWGIAFVAQSHAGENMGGFTFNASRFFLGAIALIPVIFYFNRKRKKQEMETEISIKQTMLGGLWCGVALAFASQLQQFGIQQTTVGKAGFITTLYIIFVPITGIFFRKKVKKIVWIGAIMAMIGLYLLCVSEQITFNVGDGLILLSSLVFTVHILVIDYFSPKVDGILMSAIQFIVVAVLCSIGAFVWEEPSFRQLYDSRMTILYTGILSSAVGYTFQIIGQKNFNPTIAALIMSLESVVAAIMGYFAFKIGFLKTDQTLSIRQILGCIVVFLAVILVQLPVDPMRKSIKIKN